MNEGYVLCLNSTERGYTQRKKYPYSSLALQSIAGEIGMNPKESHFVACIMRFVTLHWTSDVVIISIGYKDFLRSFTTATRIQNCPTVGGHRRNMYWQLEKYEYRWHRLNIVQRVAQPRMNVSCSKKIRVLLNIYIYILCASISLTCQLIPLVYHSTIFNLVGVFTVVFWSSLGKWK